MQSIPNFAGSRVLVVGDVMLDRYWHGDTGRISPEAPVPVVRIGGREARLGGAANVALNVAATGATAALVGVIGDDEDGAAVRELLEAAGIEARLLVSPQHPTIAKLRVISRQQQLIRLDFERGFDAHAFDAAALEAAFAALLADAGAVVCSDYAKGTLTAVPGFIAAARRAGKPVLVDPKGADWQRYAGTSLITPNWSEFLAAAGPCADEAAVTERAGGLRARLNLDALLVTRSERGMSLFADGAPLHLPTQAREVFDVTGAGDTVIAVAGAALAAGVALPDAAALANLAAGIVVGKLGTATASPAEMRRAARERHAVEAGIVDQARLAALIEEAKAHGEKVVLTNGCFDLLHPGHVAYLEAARELGDWLVVAVNSDDSVRRLKGAGRPITPLAQRMAVLCGLAAVDWVVDFHEDTPAALIEQLLPDVLVKGGDYREADIAGAAAVRAAGGDVRVLDFVPGYSTSDIVRRMQAAQADQGNR